MKRKAGHFNHLLTVFRSYYAKGENYLVTPREAPAYRKRFAKLEVTVCGPPGIEA